MQEIECPDCGATPFIDDEFLDCEACGSLYQIVQRDPLVLNQLESPDDEALDELAGNPGERLPAQDLTRRATGEESASLSMKIGGYLLYGAYFAGAAILIFMFFKGPRWIAENIQPLTVIAAWLAVLVVVPISLLLALFRKGRVTGGIGLYISSHIVFISLWVWSLLVAYFLAGVFWMIAGVVFAGVGVVPVALIASIFKAEWSVTGQILVIAVIGYTLRWLGVYLAAKE